MGSRYTSGGGELKSVRRLTRSLLVQNLLYKERLSTALLIVVVLGVTCIVSVFAASCECYPCSSLRKSTWCDNIAYSSLSKTACKTQGYTTNKVYFQVFLGSCSCLPDKDDPNYELHTRDGSIIGEHLHIVATVSMELKLHSFAISIKAHGVRP